MLLHLVLAPDGAGILSLIDYDQSQKTVQHGKESIRFHFQFQKIVRCCF